MRRLIFSLLLVFCLCSSVSAFVTNDGTTATIDGETLNTNVVYTSLDYTAGQSAYNVATRQTATSSTFYDGMVYGIYSRPLSIWWQQAPGSPQFTGNFSFRYCERNNVESQLIYSTATNQGFGVLLKRDRVAGVVTKKLRATLFNVYDRQNDDGSKTKIASIVGGTGLTQYTDNYNCAPQVNRAIIPNVNSYLTSTMKLSLANLNTSYEFHNRSGTYRLYDLLPRASRISFTNTSINLFSNVLTATTTPVNRLLSHDDCDGGVVEMQINLNNISRIPQYCSVGSIESLSFRGFQL